MEGEQKLAQFLRHQAATLKAKENERMARVQKEKEEKEKIEKEYQRKLYLKEKRKIAREKQQKEGILNPLEKRNIEREKQPKEENLNRKDKRKIKGGKQQKEKKSSWKKERKIQREKQQEEEEKEIIKGCSSSIPSTNIGFKMLQQMGYNPGLALGKHGQGRLEPVGIDIKRSRTGLGRDDVEKEKEIAQAKEMERNTQEMRMKEQDIMSDYGERRKQLWQRRKIKSSYKKVCATLAQIEEANSRPNRDNKENKQEEDVDDDKEDEEEEEVTAEDLLEVLMRLRIEFNYCFYCGCRYESADAMISNCPGVEEEDH